MFESTTVLWLGQVISLPLQWARRVKGSARRRSLPSPESPRVQAASVGVTALLPPSSPPVIVLRPGGVVVNARPFETREFVFESALLVAYFTSLQLFTYVSVVVSACPSETRGCVSDFAA